MPVRSITCLSAIIVAASIASVAHAGSCPEEHALTQPRELENMPDAGTGRRVLAAVDLNGWRDMGNFQLRMRRLVVDAKGIVPTHTHDDRPSIVYIVTGEMIEHSALCAVPIVHKAGDWTPEFGPGHAHWWENPTDKVVTLISTDVVPFTPPSN